MMKKIFLLLFICSSVFSCHFEKSESTWPQQWSEAISLEEVHPDLRRGGQDISVAPNAWMTLLRVRFHKQTLDMDQCLFYRRSADGEHFLKVLIVSKDESSCSRGLLAGETLWESGFIRDFSVRFRTDSLSLSMDGNDLKIVFMNIGQNRSYDRFARPFFENSLNGAFWIGETVTSRRVERISNQVCYQLNSKCEEILENVCLNCESGFYRVVGEIACPQGHSYYCGPERCGRRGSPACFRGQAYFNQALALEGTACFSGSPAGFCQEGLDTVCEDSILRCL